MDKINNQGAWNLINNLKAKELSNRANEVKKQINALTVPDLFHYYKHTSKLHRSLFTEKIITYYLLVYAGEANKSGFVDFCSNVILKGENEFKLLLKDPDNFYDKFGMDKLNEDYINISEIALEKLEQTLSEREFEEQAIQFLGPELLAQNSVWNQLKTKKIAFTPNLELAARDMPKVFDLFGARISQ